MMDFRPLLTSPPDPLSSNPPSHHRQTPLSPLHLHTSVFAPREPSSMIIDATSHNSSAMPVSPKQGETITADSLTNKQEQPQLVASSLTSSTWGGLSRQPLSSPLSQHAPSVSSVSASAPLSSPPALSQTFAMSHRSPSSAPAPPTQTVKEALDAAEKFHSSQRSSDGSCETWNGGSSALPATPVPSPSLDKDTDVAERDIPASAISSSNVRNYDRPDSSPSPQSHLNSSFEESETVAADGLTGSRLMAGSESFASSGGVVNLDGSFERRSRRKPTIEDIVRRVRPPVDAPPYDSEESEIEDEILQEEMLKMRARARARAENDEVDGESAMKKRRLDEEEREDVVEEDSFNDGMRQFSMNRLSRLEAVDGIPEDEEEMPSDEDVNELERNALIKDIPLTIYDIMHEVKVNAYSAFGRMASVHPPEEAKARREQYLLQLLSNLRDRCLAEGLKPEIIGAILKDVENEVAFHEEDVQDFKFKQYFAENDANDTSVNGFPPSAGVHFLSKPETEDEAMKREGKESEPPSPYPYPKPVSFLSSDSPPKVSSVPTTTTPSSSSSLSSSTSISPAPHTSSSDVKPNITTISANGIVTSLSSSDHKSLPPPLIASTGPGMGGGLPPLHPMASSLSETAFSPNMFGMNKLGSWFPGGLNNLPLYPFGPGGGGPLDHALARKFLPFEGKLGESVDKDYLKCQYCERTFRRQKNLENHVENTHQGKGAVKPRRDVNDMYFKCSHCPYTTKHQSNLYVHLRIHTGERPYICGACGVQYSQSHSLKSHIINKHDGMMSYYIKEKRTRSPRGMGYLSTQVMHDNSIFKLPPPPALLGPGMPTNLDVVNKCFELAKSEQATQHHLQQQQHQQQQQQQHLHMSAQGPDGTPGRSLPPPLTPTSGAVNASGGGSGSSTPSGKPFTSSTCSSASSNPPANPLFSTAGGGPPPHFFMNGHQLPHLMFGELPPHIRNPGHIPSGPHPSPHLFPGFPPFPPHSSAGFPGSAGLSPLSGLSPNSNASHPHQNLPPHLQLPGSMPHMSPSPLTLLQNQQIKKENDPSTPVAPPKPQAPGTPATNSTDEAIDLRKKSPPIVTMDTRDGNGHNISACGGKENCSHAAKLKYLRLNVVRMLGILVPNLNFAEKGISAESESVDELLQDVIESNTHEDDME